MRKIWGKTKRFLSNLFLKIRFFYRFVPLWSSPVWAATREAVREIAGNRNLHEASKREPCVKFCPRCGQRPDGDRRMEEARQLVLSKLDFQPRRSDVDFAIAFHYWYRIRR